MSALAQVERVGQPVVGDLVLLRQERLVLALVVDLHERLVHVVEQGGRDRRPAAGRDVEVGGASVEPITSEVRPLPAPVVAGASVPPAVVVAGEPDEPEVSPVSPVPPGEPLLLSLPQAATRSAPTTSATAPSRRDLVTVRWGEVRMTVGLLRSSYWSGESRLV